MWNKLTNFFEADELKIVLSHFNDESRISFIKKETSVLVEAKTSFGCADFKYTFTRFLASGFRLTTLSPIPLKREDIIEIGRGVLENEEFVRRLVALRLDTLEVHDQVGEQANKWQLEKYLSVKSN